MTRKAHGQTVAGMLNRAVSGAAVLGGAPELCVGGQGSSFVSWGPSGSRSSSAGGIESKVKPP